MRRSLFLFFATYARVTSQRTQRLHWSFSPFSDFTNISSLSTFRGSRYLWLHYLLAVSSDAELVVRDVSSPYSLLWQRTVLTIMTHQYSWTSFSTSRAITDVKSATTLNYPFIILKFGNNSHSRNPGSSFVTRNAPSLFETIHRHVKLKKSVPV